MGVNRSGKLVKNTGGTSTRVSNNQTLPSLERQQQIVQQYESAQPRYVTGSGVGNLVKYANDMKTRQALANDYNAIKNAQTAQTLERLGQTNVARGSNSFAVEQAKRGNLMSGLINSLADNEKFGNLTTYVTGAYTPGYTEFRRQQNEAMKGTLTNEMKSAGLTQEDIDRWNREQNNIERQQVLSDYAKKHPILATLNAFPENIAGSAEGVLDKLTNYVQGKPLESKPSNADIYRSTVSEGIDSKAGRFAYGVGNSIGDMLLANLVTGGLAKGKVGAGLMGLEKANPVMNSAVERGLSPTQALAEGIGSGITTGITEAIPFGRFAEGGHILGSMAAEGLQEGAEDIADTALDELVTRLGGNNNRSEWNQNIQMYRDAGYSEEEAKKAAAVDYLKQVGLDTLAGAISGGVMQGSSNVLNQRNLITGKPKTAQLEEQTKVEEKTEQPKEAPKQTEEDKEAVEYLRDVLEEANQMEIHPENVRTEQTIPQVEQPAQNETIPQEVHNYVNNRSQLVNYVMQNKPGYEEGQQIIRSINAMDEYMFQNHPEWMDGMTGQFKQAEYDRLMQSQPTVNETASQPIEVLKNEALEQAIRNRQTAQYTREVEALKDKLKMFGNKSFNKRLDSALKAIQNGKKDAIENLNNLMGEINETMAGEEIGVNARTLYSDQYKAMQEATNGYKVRIDPNLIKSEYDVKGLDDFNRNYMNTGSPNHIKLVSPNYKGQALNIDRVYDELYGLNIGLDAPNGRSEADLLRSLVKYINEPKSSKNETVMNSTWENTPTADNRSGIEVQAERFANETLQKIADGTLTDEDYNNFLNYLLKEGSIDNERVQDYFNDLFNDVTAAWKQMPKTPVDSAVDNLDKTLRYNLNFHGKKNQSIPKVENNEVNTGKYKTSKFANNSFKRSGIMTDEEIDANIPEEDKLYREVTDKAAEDKARETIKENGYANEIDKVINNDNWDKVDSNIARLCAYKTANDARKAVELGVDPKEAWKQSVDIFKQARRQATKGGQLIQSFKQWASMTPEGKLAQAIAYVNETAKEDKNDPWNKIVKDAQTAADVYFTDDFIAEFLNKAHQYDGQDISLARQARLNAELAHMINNQIPVKFRQKFTSLWMDNLLASFRTLISRNFGGNIGKAALDQTLVKMFSGPIDNFLSKYTGTRTTTGFTLKGLKEYGRGFKQGGKQTVRDYWMPNADPDTEAKLTDLAKEIDVFADANVTNRSGVNEDSFKEALSNNHPVFKNKALKLYDKIIKFGLAIGDNPFYKGTYNQTVLELNTLREQGKLKLPEDITDEQFDKWVKAIATAQGLEAVYQDNTKLADGAAKIKQGLGEMSEGYIGVDILSGASMPFVRTPMNVIKTNLELSPLGIVKNAIQTISEIRANLENGRSALDETSFKQARFVRETSRNLVGLILFATGLMLKNAGVLTGGYSDDDREKQAQKEAGMQEYALVNPINGNQYSINWIPGLGSSLVSAAAFDDAYRKPDQDGLDALANGIKAGSASMFEMAALQGLQRLTGSANYSSDNSLIDNVAQTVANTASSAILPSVVRQTAAALDPYKRNTYGMGGKESVYNNAIAGVPLLRQTLQPRIGMNGQPMEQNAGRNGFEKWFDNLVNPAMVTVPSALSDPVRDEATRLYNETGSTGAYQPKIGIKTLTTEDHTPTTEEYTQFLQIADGAMNQIANEVIGSDFYAGLTDEQKVETLNGIYSAVQSVERAKFLELDKEFDGAAKAYNEGGSQGLIDYYRAKDVLTNMGATNNPQNRELITESINNGTFDEMEQLGFDVNLIKRYQHAANRIPSLTPASFEQQFNAIDQQGPGESGYGSIKQSEIIDYLNQNPNAYSEEEALRIWDAYLQEYSKIPVLNNGTWSAK